MGGPEFYPYVRAIYAIAGISPTHPRGAGPLAIGLFGPEGLAYGEAGETGAAILVPVESDRWRIDVCPRASSEAASLGIARAIGAWAILSDLVPRGWGALDELATGLLIPHPALYHACVVLEMSAAEIAEAYLCPERLVAAQIRRNVSVRRSGVYRRFG